MARKESLEGTHREEKGHTVDDEIDADGGDKTDTDGLEGDACVKLISV